jgi:hypothetical protein
MSPKSSISSAMPPGVSPPRLASRALAAAHARTPPEQASGIREEDEGGGGQGGLRPVKAAEGGGGGGGAWERSESDQSMWKGLTAAQNLLLLPAGR